MCEQAFSGYNCDMWSQLPRRTSFRSVAQKKKIHFWKIVHFAKNFNSCCLKNVSSKFSRPVAFARISPIQLTDFFNYFTKLVCGTTCFLALLSYQGR